MSLKDTYISAWDNVPVNISNGGSLSGAINLGGLRLFGIVMPASWTAANLTFQVSPDGGTSWVNLFDQNGNEITAIAAASQTIVLQPTTFSAFQYLQIRSGTSATPVAQAAARSLQLIVRSI